VRRDRRGRGLRGPLAPPGVPLVGSPADRFDRIASEAVDHVERRWREQLADVEFAVDLVPAVEAGSAVTDEIESAGVPLARIFPAAGGTPTHIVLYRKPLELRAHDVADLEDLVHDVVVQIVADFLGLDPDVVDPGFGGDEDDPPYPD
jgi:predicted Zn-dependent protease with MMP-like domain